MSNKLPQDTIDRIEKEAKELYPLPKNPSYPGNCYVANDKQQAYIEAATLYETRAVELVRALEILIRFNPERDSKFAWEDMKRAAQTSIDNYNKH